MSRLRLTDSDTGESTLDVVKVEAGWSLQMASIVPGALDEFGGFLSIILTPDQMSGLIAYVDMLSKSGTSGISMDL